MLLLWIVVLVVGVAWLAHRRVAPFPALGIVAVYLLAMGAFSHAHGWMIIPWVLWLGVALMLALPDASQTLQCADVLVVSESAATDVRHRA